MKKVIAIILMIIPIISMADANLDLRNQMLDSEIAKYTTTRDEKYSALLQCEKTTQGFKIAGITTLIATGVGVYGNIKLAQKASGNSGGAGKTAGAQGIVSDNRAQSDKDCDSLKKLQKKGLATQDEVNEVCK